jgi:hypothetical protein
MVSLSGRYVGTFALVFIQMIAVTLEQGFGCVTACDVALLTIFVRKLALCKKIEEAERSEASENERNRAPNLPFAKCTSLS